MQNKDQSPSGDQNIGKPFGFAELDRAADPDIGGFGEVDDDSVVGGRFAELEE